MRFRLGPFHHSAGNISAGMVKQAQPRRGAAAILVDCNDVGVQVAEIVELEDRLGESMSAEWLDVVVSARSAVAQDICSYELRAPNGVELPAFTPGAHVRVDLGAGLNRTYSICSDPQDLSHYVIAVLKEPNGRGGSVAMHDRVQTGSTLRISRPVNHFPLSDEAPHHVLMAGGIGVTPLLAMARTLKRNGASYELHYASRSPERAAFADLLESGALGSMVHTYFDSQPHKKLEIAQVLSASAPHSHVYVCGPSGFIEAVRSTASALGWDTSRVHFELFAAPPVVRAVAQGEFEVRLVKRGISLVVPPDKSVLDVLKTQGIPMDSSCEQGVCGVCVTRVVAGEPDHRDMFFTDAEHARNDCFTPCCSRSKSPVLVLDL